MSLINLADSELAPILFLDADGPGRLASIEAESILSSSGVPYRPVPFSRGSLMNTGDPELHLGNHWMFRGVSRISNYLSALSDYESRDTGYEMV